MRTSRLLIWATYLILAFFSANRAVGQAYLNDIRAQLDSLSLTQKGLNESVAFEVDGIDLKDFVRAVASTHQLNLSIDQSISVIVNNNFSNAKVKDVLIYLCKQYSLDIELVGAIIHLKKHIPVTEPIKIVSKIPKIDYNNQNNFLSLELRKDTLWQVAQEITKLTPYNLVLSPGLENELVSVFIINRPFEDAMQKFCFANDLKLTPEGSFYLLEKNLKIPEVQSNSQRKKDGVQTSNNPNQLFEIKDGLIKVDAQNIPLKQILETVARESFNNYFIYSDLAGNASLYIENATFDQFLNYLLKGTNLTFVKENEVYLIGERSKEGFRTTQLVQLQNRTVETVINFIPEDLKKGVDIKEFIELNGLVLSGSALNIYEIKQFIQQLDLPVPVITIEVLIVDVNKNRALTTGISAGVDKTKTPENNAIKVSPGIDATLNSQSINKLITGFNGYGIVNLGAVLPDFYLNIQALETDGVIKTRSTPKLSTLNGHEASLKIGKTEYYLEVSNNVIGSQNPSFITTQNYKSTNADLSVTIKPIVSSDNLITLDITVQQSDFTARISENAPPGTVTRTFKSIIKVKNNEMILLGGLEDESVNSSGSGLPFISRVPILKWIFGTRTKSNSKTKLSIFIRPTVLY